MQSEFQDKKFKVFLDDNYSFSKKIFNDIYIKEIGLISHSVYWLLSNNNKKDSIDSMNDLSRRCLISVKELKNALVVLHKISLIDIFDYSGDQKYDFVIVLKSTKNIREIYSMTKSSIFQNINLNELETLMQGFKDENILLNRDKNSAFDFKELSLEGEIQELELLKNYLLIIYKRNISIDYATYTMMKNNNIIFKSDQEIGSIDQLSKQLLISLIDINGSTLYIRKDRLTKLIEDKNKSIFNKDPVKEVDQNLIILKNNIFVPNLFAEKDTVKALYLTFEPSSFLLYLYSTSNKEAFKKTIKEIKSCDSLLSQYINCIIHFCFLKNKGVWQHNYFIKVLRSIVAADFPSLESLMENFSNAFIKKSTTRKPKPDVKKSMSSDISPDWVKTYIEEM
jgi:replication initiation and membrane attachment protein DnaB